MPSSISSSETASATSASGDRRYERAIVMALAGAAMLWAGLEASTYFGLRGISRIERRTQAEHAAARAVRPAQGNAPPSVLVMGNSLLLEGVDYDAIRKLAAPHAQVTRFVVENTSYYEWYFGIRKLRAEGSRPDVMILCLSPSQLIGASIGSDYAMHHFFLPRDVYAVSRAVGYDMTQASGLMFAQYSLYYARRNTLRSFLMSEIGTAYWRLAHELGGKAPQFPPSQEAQRIAEERLRAVAEAATAGGGRFVFLIPPGFGEGEREIAAAGAKTGTPVMVPVHLGALPSSHFSDGFHLNAEGARIFTSALSAQLAGLREGVTP